MDLRAGVLSESGRSWICSFTCSFFDFVPAFFEKGGRLGSKDSLWSWGLG